jgi:hypothetical protein
VTGLGLGALPPTLPVWTDDPATPSAGRLLGYGSKSAAYRDARPDGPIPTIATGERTRVVPTTAVLRRLGVDGADRSTDGDLAAEIAALVAEPLSRARSALDDLAGAVRAAETLAGLRKREAGPSPPEPESPALAAAHPDAAKRTGRNRRP